MNVFSMPESERPSSFELASNLHVNVEDNTRLLLDAPPWLPSQKKPPWKMESQKPTNANRTSALPVSDIVNLLSGSKFPSWGSVKSQLVRKAQNTSTAAIDFTIKIGSWALLILTMLFVGYRCMFYFSFPANVVAAVAFFASVSWLGSATGIWSYLGFANRDDS